MIPVAETTATWRESLPRWCGASQDADPGAMSARRAFGITGEGCFSLDAVDASGFEVGVPSRRLAARCGDGRRGALSKIDRARAQVHADR